MADVSQWSTTAASNNSTPPNGAPEGMAPSTVNNVIRENMAANAKWYSDSDGTLQSTGSSSAYVLATNSTHAALADMPLVAFRANHASTGASTLAVDGLAAKAIVKNHDVNLAAGDIEVGQIVIVVYNATDDKYELISSTAISSSVITTRGDVIRGSSSGIAERLGIGSSGQALTSDGTDVVWGAAGGPSVGTEAIIRTNATNIIANTTLSEKELTYTAVHGAETLSRGTNDGFANGDTVQLLNSGGAAPAGWSVGTQYYVVSVAAATMQLSTSFGGGAAAISDNGSGTNTVYKNINGMSAGPITINSGTVQIRSGSQWNII